MSAAGVQRAIIRMMLDPAFRDAVYADGARALAGCDVDDGERAWLVRPDRRAYATDPSRQARALLALAEELPAATAWARAEGRPPSAFFASAELHGCVEDRGVLTFAYAGWLRAGATEPLRTLVALEEAVARGRRARAADQAGDHFVLAPTVALVPIVDGALAWWDAVRAAAAAGAPLPPLPAGEPATALVEVKPDGTASAELLAAGLAALLAAARTARSRADLEHTAIELGLDPDEARELVDDLLATGVLTVNKGGDLLAIGESDGRGFLYLRQ